MGTAHSLRPGDLRRIYRLLGECRDRGEEPRAWRQHLFEGVRGLTRSLVAVGGEARRQPENILVPQPTRGVMDLGWPDEAARLRFLEFLNKQDVHQDEFAMAVGQQMLPLFTLAPRRVVTRRRCELIPDGEWYASRAFRHYHEYCGIDDYIFSLAGLDEEMVHVIALHRPLGGVPFTRRDARLVHWLHAELRELMGPALARGPRVREDRPGLSPRLREVLEYLLAGDSEKEVAHNLGISQATVHEHVKRLHRLLEVSTRGELLSQAQRVLDRPDAADLTEDARADGQ